MRKQFLNSKYETLNKLEKRNSKKRFEKYSSNFSFRISDLNIVSVLGIRIYNFLKVLCLISQILCLKSKKKGGLMTYVIYKDKLNEWRWYLKAANGKKIADSGEGYKNKSDCLNAIGLVKNSKYAGVEFSS